MTCPKSPAPSFPVSVLMKAGSDWFIYVDSSRIFWSVSLVPSLYPTNSKQVGSYLNLTISYGWREKLQSYERMSLLHMTIE